LKLIWNVAWIVARAKYLAQVAASEAKGEGNEPVRVSDLGVATNRL
jgi:hypothetical protein